MLKKIISCLLLLMTCVLAMAIPARPGVYTLTQPDGSTFQAKITGDEFFRLTKTTDGCAVILDDDGYYCYAFFGLNGHRFSSGIHVSAANSSSPAAAASRVIPVRAMNRLAAGKRSLMSRKSAAQLISEPATRASSNTKKVIVILAQFSDLKFKYTRSNFNDMLTKHGYDYNGATGSAMDYLNDQFEGTMDFDIVVSDIVTLSRGYAYYGKNDSEGQDEKAHEAVAEACRLADANIDFSQFDGDGDGEVDNVFVFFAGPDEAHGASEDHIWSHQWYLLDGAGQRLTLDGKLINSYALSSETSRDSHNRESFTTIGTFCHEYSHVLGLRDMYDTDYEDGGGQADCLWWSTSLMDGGSYNNGGNTPPNYNAFELSFFGLGTQEKLDLGEWAFAPISKQKRYGRIDGPSEDEYFLVECRDNSGWDQYIGGAGMLVYHIDHSNNPAGYSDRYKQNFTAIERFIYNEVNCRPDHQCVDIIEAHTPANDISHAFWPYLKTNALSPDSHSDFKYWNGKKPTTSLIGIRRVNDYVTFTLAGPLAIDKMEAFQDAAIVQWHMASGSIGTTGYISISDGSKTTEYQVTPYQVGQYAYVFEGLKEKTEYTVKVSSQPGGKGDSVSDSFTTKAFYNDGYPFIYLNSADRNTDGTFIKNSRMPLRIYNARNVAEVAWYFNSIRIEDDGSGYWIAQMDGTLKAVIFYKDGTKDIITKRITVR